MLNSQSPSFTQAQKNQARSSFTLTINFFQSNGDVYTGDFENGMRSGQVQMFLDILLKAQFFYGCRNHRKFKFIKVNANLSLTKNPVISIILEMLFFPNQTMLIKASLCSIAKLLLIPIPILSPFSECAGTDQLLEWQVH